jgi:hypothetical protein
MVVFSSSSGIASQLNVKETNREEVKFQMILKTVDEGTEFLVVA